MYRYRISVDGHHVCDWYGEGWQTCVEFVIDTCNAQCEEVNVKRVDLEDEPLRVDPPAVPNAKHVAKYTKKLLDRIVGEKTVTYLKSDRILVHYLRLFQPTEDYMYSVWRFTEAGELNCILVAKTSETIEERWLEFCSINRDE
jgi:hypothetical protein